MAADPPAWLSAVIRRWSRRAGRQAAALPWRRTPAGGIEVLLITSRGTGRWILPKGWIEPGEGAAAAAAREAWEEAGVRGQVAPRPLGSYPYVRTPEGGARACRVAVFPLRVEAELDAWPEQAERRRVWVAPAEAAERVAEPELRALLAAFRPEAGLALAFCGRSR